VRGGAASLYAKGSVVWPGYGVFEVRAHEFLRSVCIRYVTLRHYHIRWWYWSKKRRLYFSYLDLLHKEEVQESIT